MIFSETELAGLVVVQLERDSDERGSFARTFDAAEWEHRGMCTRVVQCSISHNAARGTLRGMHFQEPPHAEAKLVRCSRGTIFDVAVDIRRDSASFRRWFGLELSEENGRMLYIPEGFAHGFVTLTDNTQILYQISQSYVPESSRGVRWDDPAFAIGWPAAPLIISERDRGFPDFV